MDFGNNHHIAGQWLDPGLIGAGARLVANHMIDHGYGPSVKVEHSPGGATGATEPGSRSNKRKTRGESVQVANPRPQEPEDIGPYQGENRIKLECTDAARDFAVLSAQNGPGPLPSVMRPGSHLGRPSKRLRGSAAGMELKQSDNGAVRAQLAEAVDRLRAEIEAPPVPPALESDSDDPQIKQQLQIQQRQITEARRYVQQLRLAELQQCLGQMEESEHSSPVQPVQAPVAGGDRHALIHPVTPSPAQPANMPATRRVATARPRTTSSAPTPSREAAFPTGPTGRAPDVSLQRTRIEQQKREMTAGIFNMPINGTPDIFSVRSVLTQEQINALPVFQKGAKGAQDSAEFCHLGMEDIFGDMARNDDINGTPSSSSASSSASSSSASSSFAPSLGAAEPFSMQELAPAQPFSMQELAPAQPFSMQELAPAQPFSMQELAPAQSFSMQELAPAQPSSSSSSASASFAPSLGAAEPFSMQELAPAQPFSMEELAPAQPFSMQGLAPAQPFSMQELAPAQPFSMQELAPAQPFSESYDHGVSQVPQYEYEPIVSWNFTFTQHDILPQQQDLSTTNHSSTDCQTEDDDSDDVCSEDEYSKDGHLHNHSQPQPGHDNQNHQLQPQPGHDHQNQQLQLQPGNGYQDQQLQPQPGHEPQNQQLQLQPCNGYQNQQLQPHVNQDHQDQQLQPHHDQPRKSEYSLSLAFPPVSMPRSCMAAMASVQMSLGCETKCELDRILVFFLRDRQRLIQENVPMDKVIGPHHPSVRSLLYAGQSRFAHPVSRVMLAILATFANLTGLTERVAMLYNMFSLLRWQLDPTDMNHDSMPGYMMPVGNQLTHPHPAWIDYIPFPAMRQRIIADGTAMTNHVWPARIRSDGEYQLNDDAPVAQFIESYPFESIRHSFFSTLSVNWPYLDTDSMITDPQSAEIMLNPVFMRHLIQPENWSLGEAFAGKFPGLVGTYRFEKESGPSGH